MIDETMARAGRKPLGKQTVLALEALVVLLYGYCPAFFSQFTTRLAYSHGAIVPILRVVSEIAYLGPVLLIVWVADSNFKSIGMAKPVWKVDIWLACGLVAFMFALSNAPHLVLSWEQIHYYDSMGRAGITGRELRDSIPLWATVPGTVASVFFQEILMRGYFVGRLKLLTGNTWLPVISSSVLFGLWHVYQGPIGAVSAGVMGLVFALCFAKTNRLWPMIFAHLVNNLWFAVTVAALLNGGSLSL
jgi:membrane protease YdiL (CAAX protease family)